MKGKGVYLHSGQSGGSIEGYRTTFSIEDSNRMDCVDWPDQRMPTRRVEVPQSRLPKMGSNSEWIDAADDVAPVSKRWDTIRLSDTESVRVALWDRLLLLQQQVLKRIAKAWIKALCPKKQARYPYRSKQQREEPGVEPDIPEWWNIDVCAHIEPDHVDKDGRYSRSMRMITYLPNAARTSLCLHILRLRPSSQQLKKWNGDLYVPNKTLETRGWTAFLQEQTQFSSMLVGLGKSPEPEEKLRLRQKILDDLYHIAGEEEGFLKGDRGKSSSPLTFFGCCTNTKSADGDIIQIEGYDNAAMASNKKSQAKKRVRDDRDNNVLDTTIRRQKKTKHNAAHGTRRSATLEEGIRTIDLAESNTHTCRRLAQIGMDPDYVGARAIKSERRPSRTSKSRRQVQTGPNLPMGHPFGLIPEAIPQWYAADPSSSSQGGSPFTLTGSFGGSHSDHESIGGLPQVQGAPSNLPGRRGLTLEELEYHQRMMHVYNVPEVPHPQFATVPKTPMVSPSIVKLENSPEVARWPEEYQVAPAMERYPEHMSALQHFEFTGPGPASQHVMVPSNDPYARMPFQEPSQLRSITPAPEVRGTYGTGFQMVGYGEAQYHGLPISYNQDYPTPEENGDPAPFLYPGPTPGENFPAATLPASVERGFTGTSSGVGKYCSLVCYIVPLTLTM